MKIEDKLPDMQPTEMDFLLSSAANVVSIKDISMVEVFFVLENKEKESLEEATHTYRDVICPAISSKPCRPNIRYILAYLDRE